KQYAMSAPPGTAYFHWDSVPPFDEGPRRLEALPGWTTIQIPIGSAREIATLIRSIIARARDNSSLEEALTSSLNDESSSMRRMAVYGLGAIDDLPRLIDVLSSNKHQDTRDVSVIALRHWIGRAEGQDAKLYEALIKKGVSEKHATAIMQLLHSFGDEQ